MEKDVQLLQITQNNKNWKLWQTMISYVLMEQSTYNKNIGYDLIGYNYSQIYSNLSVNLHINKSTVSSYI